MTESRKAFSLLEVLLVSVIMAVILAVTINLVRSGLSASSRTVTQGATQEEACRVVDALSRELKDSGEGCTGWAVGLNPSPPSQYYGQDVSRISFSRCIGYDPTLELLQWGPVVTYEYQNAVGDEPGKLARTEGGVRVTVCDHVSQFLVHYMPDNSVVVVTLTVECDDPESPGHTIRASHTRNVRLRN
jgi:prepilin-type N-terminal cleavage/methylation domain-containing protein